MHPDCVQLGQDNARSVYRRGTVCTLHGHTQRYHWHWNAYPPVADGLVVAYDLLKEDSVDCYLSPRHHVGLPIVL